MIKPGSQPRPEFLATSSSPSSHRTIANQTASSRSCPTKRKPLWRHYRSRSSTAWVQRRRPRCTPSALKRARTCDGKPSISYRTASARQRVGTTTSREVGTTGRSNLTENESRWDRRRRSRRTGLIPFGRCDRDGRRCLGLVRESELSWSDRHGEDQMGRLSNIHSQPVDGNDDPNEGETASGRPRQSALSRGCRRLPSGKAYAAGPLSLVGRAQRARPSVSASV